jgi:pimeloyl-ACP methyl ester carboxylesterase
MAASSQISPFTSRTSPQELADLRARLRATRWADAPAGLGWSLGTDDAALRALVEDWATFDWPAWEERLNHLPRLRVALDGLDGGAVHAIRVRGRRAPREGAGDGLPVLLCHGWPDACWRYLPVVDALAAERDVVVPDMPGFGWSPAPARLLSSRDVAALWAELMTTLGYDRFAVSGGDVGSHVARYLALDFPDRVVVVHRTDAGLPSPALDRATLSPAEQDWLDRAAAWSATEGGYAAMHRTKPQTLAAGLTDSPVGLAAWIGEKLHGWGSAGLDGYPREDVLALLSLYWFTRSIGSSVRMYHANAALPPAQLLRRVEVPSAFALYGGDILPPPREWLERSTRLVRLTRHERGGHFPPVEVPEVFAADLAEVLRQYA